MDYAIKILEEELKKTQKIEARNDYTSSTTRININVLNDILDLKTAISILNRDKVVRISYS